MTLHRSPVFRHVPGWLLLAAATATQAQSDTPSDTPPDAEAPAPAAGDAQSRWSVGLGVGVQQSPYRDVGREVRPLPLLTYENRWVRVAGPGVDLKMPTPRPLRWTLGLRLGQGGYRADDSPALAGMADRKDGLAVASGLQWRTPGIHGSVDLQHDVSGNSKGTQLRVSLGHGVRLGRVQLEPRIAALWQDRRHVDFFYGVKANEAAAGRPAYAGRATGSAELGLRAGMPVAPRQAVFLDLSLRRLGAGIADSPLVDDDTLVGLNLGYLYRF